MKKRMRGLIALLLAFILLLPRPVRAAESVYPPLSHEPVPAEIFTDLAMDPSELESVTERIDAALAGPEEEKAQTLPALYEELLSAYDHLEAQYVMIEYAYAKNVNDELIRRLEEESTSKVYDCADAAMLAVKKMLEDPAGEFLTKELAPDLLDEVREYEPLTEEQKARQERISALVNDYRTAMGADYTVTYGGREWTEDDLNDEPSLDPDTLRRIYFAILKQKNEAAGPIYKELVSLYTEEAEENGYENYADYAHENVHGRDYTAKDLKEFLDAVKEEVAPLDEEFSYAVYDESADTSMFDDASQEQILDVIGPYIGQVAPELTEAYDYMRENGLADIAEDPNREDGAFTSALSEYHAAVLLINAYGSYWDYKTLVHEFGHFNAAYHNPEHALWNDQSTDVAEVQSQGLEVLFLPYWSRISGDDETGRYFTLQVLEDMLYSVVTGCMMNECETYAFTHPQESLEEWNRAFGQIYKDYGYEYLTEDGASYSWVEVGHLFEAPLYYISYATSAIAALTIWSEAEEDRDGAIEKYLAVSACTNERFLAMLDKCGLPDVFEEDTIDAVCDHLERILYEEDRVEEVPFPAGNEPRPEGPSEWEDDWKDDHEDDWENDWEDDPADDWEEYVPGDNDDRFTAAAAIALVGYFGLRWTIIAVMLLVLSSRRKKRLARMGLDKNGHRTWRREE